jgi:tetratricopeptide (TPR) repeat protein
MIAMQQDAALKFGRKWIDQINQESSSESEKVDYWDLGARIGIACNLAEISLNNGEEVNAGRYVHELVIQNLEHPRLLALQSRLMVRRGDWKSADEFYGKAIADSKSTQITQQTSKLWDCYGIGNTASLDNEIWLTNAAWDLHRWQEAIQTIDVYHQAHPLEPSANLQFAKLRIKLIERQQVCDLLECSRNSAGSLNIPGNIQTTVLNALQIASQAVNSWEPTYWLARAKAAFELNQENLEMLAKNQPAFEDGAPYAMGLWKLNQKDKIPQLINSFPPTPALYLLAALSCVNIDNEKAIDLSRRAISNSVNDPLFYAGAAYVAHHFGNNDLALQALETALLTYPDEPKWRSLAAELARNVGDIGKEIQHLECALGIEPENIQINIRLAKAAIEVNNPALAIEILNGVSVLDPQNAEILHVLALANFKNLEFDRAMEICESARNLENMNYVHWLLSAQIAFETEDLPSALQYAQTASQLNPNSADTLYLMVQILKSSGDTVGALNVLENGIKSIQPTVALLLERARLVAVIDGAQAAIPLIADILDKNEGNAEIFAFLADVQKDAGDYQGAEQTAMASLDFDPNQPRVFILLGTINNQTGHLDRAVNHFSKAIELDPDDLQGYLELGKTYQNRRDYMKALQTYQRAMIAKPVDYRPYYHAGLVLRETKNYAEAESMLRKAVDLNPQDVNIRRQLGAIVALNLVHNKEEARVAQ